MICIQDLLEQRTSDLIAWSPYNFIRDVNSSLLVKTTVIDPLLKDLYDGCFQIKEINIGSTSNFFLFKKLEWDTDYFGFPVYNIRMIAYDHNDVFILNEAIKEFFLSVIRKAEYWFINIPADDILLVQGLCNTSFKLVETRLSYFLADICNFKSDRFPVRKAGIADKDDLRRVAIKMRNNYDRVHADPAFSTEQADEYLGTFIEESLKGFADYVLVPDTGSVKPFGFLAANKPIEILERKISKLVLTAVDSSVQKGWLFRLLTEMIYLVKNEGADYMTTVTQAANKPAVAIWEKAGFRLNSVSHIFSIKL